MAEYDVIDLLGLVDESYQSDLPLCIQALADPSEDYNVRWYALNAIKRIGYQSEEAVGVLIQLLNDDNPNFRLQAARLLGKVIGANRFSAADALARRVREWRWTSWVQIQVRSFVSLTRLVGLRNALKRVLYGRTTGGPDRLGNPPSAASLRLSPPFSALPPPFGGGGESFSGGGESFGGGGESSGGGGESPGGGGESFGGGGESFGGGGESFSALPPPFSGEGESFGAFPPEFRVQPIPSTSGYARMLRESNWSPITLDRHLLQ
ncbi:MAG: HEAT repeat domain-containing protein [Armatimonadetes bacterium]|nr:HEAT repeat domain-containing protein [Armatimonadota bacterium]